MDTVTQNHHKVIITEYGQLRLAIQYKHDRAVWLSAAKTDNDTQVGLICVATVRDVVPTIGAYFVEYQPGEKGYLAFEEAAGAYIIHRQSAKKISCGDEILIQVKKDRVGSKAAVLTGNINLSGSLIVLSLSNRKLGFSKHLSDDCKRRLRHLCQHREQQPFGVIFRTNCEAADDEAILQEWRRLENNLQDIVAAAATRKPATALHQQELFCRDLLLRLPLREPIRLITDQPEIYHQLDKLKQVRMFDHWQLELYQDDQLSLSACYQLPKLISRLTAKRLWLRSGAWISIEPTEAMTVIDVNSGKMEAKKNKAEAALKINREAAEMIARQLCLRNISGIILIDFINMNSDEDRAALYAALEQLCLQDPIPVQLHGFTKLGLFEMTRKKERLPLHQLLSESP